MATIYYKFSGELITVQDAKAAENAFVESGGLPDGYEFLNWSSTSTTNTPVTAFEEGGEGVMVTEALTYYPVIGVQEIISLSIQGSSLNYVINANDDTNAIFAALPINEVSPDATGYFSEQDFVSIIVTVGATSFYAGSYQFLFVQNNVPDPRDSTVGQSGSVTLNNNAINVNFGIIELPEVLKTQTEIKAFKTVNTIDGQTYLMKVCIQGASYNGGIAGLYVAIYREENGVPVLLNNENSIVYYRKIQEA